MIDLKILMMKKNRTKLGIGLGIFFVFFVLTLVLTLPSWQGKFRLNADILPTNKLDQALFYNENPEFRVEFGDKERLSDYVWRWEKYLNRDQRSVQAKKTNEISADGVGKALAVVERLGWEKVLVSANLDDQNSNQEKSILAEDEEILRLIKSDFVGDNSHNDSEKEIEKIVEEKITLPKGMSVISYQGVDAVYTHDLVRGIDMRTTVLSGRGIRDEIVIMSEKTPDHDLSQLKNKFTFLLNLDPGVKMSWSPTSLNGGFQGTYYFTDLENNYLWHLQEPVLIDAAGVVSAAINMNLSPVVDDSQNPDYPNLYLLTLDIEPAWLMTSGRQFPVTLTQDLLIDAPRAFSVEQKQELNFDASRGEISL